MAKDAPVVTGLSVAQLRELGLKAADDMEIVQAPPAKPARPRPARIEPYTAAELAELLAGDADGERQPLPVPATATTAVERSERAVWRAVIALAVSDAVAVNRSISGVFSEHDISEARIFLTAVSGEWAKHRRFVCALADLEETRLVAFARNAIKAVAG